YLHHLAVGARTDRQEEGRDGGSDGAGRRQGLRDHQGRVSLAKPSPVILEKAAGWAVFFALRHWLRGDHLALTTVWVGIAASAVLIVISYNQSTTDRSRWLCSIRRARCRAPSVLSVFSAFCESSLASNCLSTAPAKFSVFQPFRVSRTFRSARWRGREG